MRSKFLVVILGIVGLIVVGCDSKQVYSTYQTVPSKWHKDSVKTFKLIPPDTIKPYNLFITLRNTSEYKYNNLFVIAELNYPNGKVIKDTLEYRMAAPNGELLGEGFSDVKENKLWYKGYESPFVFNESGEYVFKVQHAMRQNGNIAGDEFLEGITDIGFRVEKVDNN